MALPALPTADRPPGVQASAPGCNEATVRGRALAKVVVSSLHTGGEKNRRITPPPPKKGPCPFLAEGRLVRKRPLKPRRVLWSARLPHHTHPPFLLPRDFAALAPCARDEWVWVSGTTLHPAATATLPGQS